MKKTGLFFLLFLLPAWALYSQENPLLDSWDSYLKNKELTPYHFDWISLGPVMNSARVEAVQGDPNKPGTWYVAFGSGNLWKTTDHGLRWKPIFENQPVLGIGDIALAPSDSEIIYLGSGESLKKPRNFTMPGVGVFRSDDGGETWRHLGLTDSYHIGEIAVHPENADIAFVAVMGHFWSANPNRGVYRTLDGGETWDHVLYIDEKTGANDIVISPSDPDIIYTSMWENNPGISGPNSGVYRSSDGGETWNRLTSGFPSGDNTGRIGLAVSWQNPDKVYALVDNLNKNKNKAAEFYQSNNGGENWLRTHDEDLSIFPGIGWYFTDTYVNPENDDEVYLLGVRAAYSTDGGETFELVGGEVFHLNPNPAIPLHLDHCEMWVNPNNPHQLLLGNDGGFYVSYNKGGSWMHYNNLPVGEFYDISVDNLDPYRVYGGVQDNSSVYGSSSEWIPQFADRWKYIWVDAWSGGDGCVTLPDPTDSTIIYTSSQNGGIFRKNMATQTSKGIRPNFPRRSGNRLAYNFVAPYIISPHNPTTLYHAGNFIFKSIDKGDNWDLISTDLSESSIPSKKSIAAGAIAESPIKPGLLYVGTDKGGFWMSADDGETWTEYSDGLPDAYIRSISPSRFAEGRVYISLSGMNYDDLDKHLFVSEDHGANWTSIDANLPNEVVNCVLEDVINQNLIFAGTMRGVYASIDRGQSWSLFGSSMAPMAISDLVMQENEQDLVVGTHGRGIYKMCLRPLYHWLEYIDENGEVPAEMLFTPPPLKAPWYNDTHRDADPRTLVKTSFTFWLDHNEEVSIRIMDKNKEVYAIPIYGYTGFNQVRWDGVVRNNQSSQPYFIHYKTYITPGNYRIELVGERFELSSELTVLKGTKPDY